MNISRNGADLIKFSAVKKIPQISNPYQEVNQFARETNDRQGIIVLNPSDSFIASGSEAQQLYQAALDFKKEKPKVQALTIDGATIDRHSIVETWNIGLLGRVVVEDDLDRAMTDKNYFRKPSRKERELFEFLTQKQ